METVDAKDAGSSAQAVWQILKDGLSSRLDGVNREIKTYPTPIAACDEQFNHLLQRQSELQVELRKLDLVQGLIRRAPESFDGIKHFIVESAQVDDELWSRVQPLIPNPNERESQE